MKNLMLFSFILAASTTFAQQTHQLVLQNEVFYPEFLVIEAGETVELQLTRDHTLTEVSSGTFRAGGVVPNGGIHIGFGTAHDGERTSFTINEPGDYYFVSEARNAPLAKTRITVLASSNTGVTADADQFSPVVYPNPADDQVRFAAHEHLDMISVEAFDQSGRLVLKDVVRGNEPLNIMALPSGHYTLRLTDGMSMVYGVERLIVDRDLGGL